MRHERVLKAPVASYSALNAAIDAISSRDHRSCRPRGPTWLLAPLLSPALSVSPALLVLRPQSPSGFLLLARVHTSQSSLDKRLRSLQHTMVASRFVEHLESAEMPTLDELL